MGVLLLFLLEVRDEGDEQRDLGLGSCHQELFPAQTCVGGPCKPL